MADTIEDQLALCKTALRKAMGHLARLERWLKAKGLIKNE